ncbi:hypothetical protein PIB30_023535, partial [Stylosanthes scabra]|nr:hypothetical protein [Stylosanthes scabra]
MAYPDKVREWFKNNPNGQKISDPETTSFLNQKAQIQAALQAPNQNNQSKENFNKSPTCLRKMKNSHLIKKVMKTFQKKMTISESILKMIKNRNCCNSPSQSLEL